MHAVHWCESADVFVSGPRRSSAPTAFAAVPVAHPRALDRVLTPAATIPTAAPAETLAAEASL